MGNHGLSKWYTSPKQVVYTCCLVRLESWVREFRPFHFFGPQGRGFSVRVMLEGHTVDGRNPAPPEKPWNDDSPVNTNKQWLPMVSKWCRILSIHSREPKEKLCPRLEENRSESCPERIRSIRVILCLRRAYSTAWIPFQSRKRKRYPHKKTP